MRCQHPGTLVRIFLTDLIQPFSKTRTGGLIITELTLQSLLRHPHVEPAILANDSIHRPHARDMITPASWPSRHRHNSKPGIMRPPESVVGLPGNSPIGRDRVIDIGKQATNVL